MKKETIEEAKARAVAALRRRGESGVSGAVAHVIARIRREIDPDWVKAIEEMSSEERLKWMVILADEAEGRVVKLADTHGLGPCAFGRAGSTPVPATKRI